MQIEPDLSKLRTKPIAKPTRARKNNVDCCQLCNRPISLDGTTLYARVVAGSGQAIHRDDSGSYIGSEHDRGFQTIGPECARKLGNGFVFSIQEAEWFMDRSLGRPITLGPITPMEDAWMKFTPWEREQVEQSIAAGQDLPYMWSRDRPQE